jgi:3-deoxy-D-manno-octulosonate 8-phosphate phosphatase (KDO 8-P phosphatase)
MNERVAPVRLLVLDVDGVLTDGVIVYEEDGAELKAFHTHDGLGIRLALNSGLAIAIMTGRSSRALRRRAEELGVTRLMQGVRRKGEAVRQLAEDLSLSLDEVGFVGDDLIDLPAMRRVGFAVAVSNAVDEVKSAAHMVTTREGGRGAVREAIEFILRTQGRWDSAISQYVNPRE